MWQKYDISSLSNAIRHVIWQGVIKILCVFPISYNIGFLKTLHIVTCLKIKKEIKQSLVRMKRTSNNIYAWNVLDLCAYGYIGLTTPSLQELPMLISWGTMWQEIIGEKQVNIIGVSKGGDSARNIPHQRTSKKKTSNNRVLYNIVLWTYLNTVK